MKYESCSDDEASDLLILDTYFENYVRFKDSVKEYTRNIISSSGNKVSPMLLMAKVNKLIEDRKHE